MKNKKIVIAGGTGFIGQSLVAFFGMDNDIVILGRHIPADPKTGSKLLTTADGWWSNLNIASFAQDTDGELYLVDVRTSGIYKLVPGS